MDKPLKSVPHGQSDAQTFDYLPGPRASLPFGRYQIVLLGDRGSVSNLPRVVA